MKKENIFVNSELLELFEDQFSADSFRMAIDRKYKESNQIISTVIGSATGKEKEDDVKFVVNLPDDMKDAYKNGDIKFDTGKNGEMYAQLRKNGKYGKKLSISEELGENGLSETDIAFAAELNAIKETLTKIVDALEEIEGYVIDTVEGLHNDRVGLLYSGLSTYMEASQIPDSSLKELLISQAIKSLNDSQAQIMQEFKYDLQYLVNHEFDNEKGKRKKIIYEKMGNIHRCFEVIYRAFMIKSMIYFDVKQLPAMFMSFEEYGRFIEKLIKPNASKLAEFDPKEGKLINTIWQKRSSSFKECSGLKTKLLTANTFYISTED